VYAKSLVNCNLRPVLPYIHNADNCLGVVSGKLKLNCLMLRVFQVLILLICPFLLNAQSVDRSVVGAFGGTITVGSITSSSSIGELNVDHYDGNFFVQQGFIQAEQWSFVGTEEDLNSESLNLYPNPSSTNFTIDFSNAGDFDGQIQVFDLNGKLIYTDNSDFQSHLVVDATAWIPGIYFVRIVSGAGKAYNLKFQKV
jgi:hypothetical protein